MKQFQLFTSIVLITVISSLQSCSNSTEKHIGEWKGENNGQTGTLVLDKSYHAVLITGNQVVGGDNFVFRGKKAEVKYEIDYSKEPIWLDLIFYEQGKTEEAGRMKGIIRFITDNKMEYRVDFEGYRFENFDPEDKTNTIVLDRVLN